LLKSRAASSAEREVFFARPDLAGMRHDSMPKGIEKRID
jgi:hypothetical protein